MSRRAATVAVGCLLAVGACSSAPEGPVPTPSSSEGVAQQGGLSPSGGDTGLPGPSKRATPGAPQAGDSANAPPTEGLPTAAWTLRAPAPLPRTEVAAAPFGGQVWVAGGYTAEGLAAADVQVYDPAFDAWSTGPTLPDGVHHATLVSAGDRLLLIGGFDQSGDPVDDVRVFDPAAGVWEDGPGLPAARGAGAGAWDGARVVFGGGAGPDGLAGEVYALEDGVWREIGALSQAREHLGAASDGAGRVFFLGGRLEGIDTNLAAVDLVDGDAIEVVGELPTARGGVSAFYAGAAGACTAGGEGPEGTFFEVECLDAAGDVTTLPDLAEPRHGIGAVVAEGNAYVLLGGPEPGLTVSGTVQALPIGAAGSG